MSRRSILIATASATLAAVLALIVAAAFASSPPGVSGGSATAVTQSSATLGGSVNPSGQETTYAFEYGTHSYTNQTPAHSAGAGTQPVPVTTQISSLRAGTTYHYRIIATNAGGTATGSDATFTTAGIAPPEPQGAEPVTAAATGMGIETATLNGTIDTAPVTSGETQSYYFQIGPSQPYTLQTTPQPLKGDTGTVPVTAPAIGLASMQTFHYRLVTVTEAGKVTAGADKTFVTLPRERLHPQRVEMSATPANQQQTPDRVTVSGRMVPPRGMSNFIGCRGYFDITFRVRQIAVQSLRAGIQKDCTFSLPVVFHNRRRLMGGQLTVHALFAGSRFLFRLEAPTRTIQVG